MSNVTRVNNVDSEDRCGGVSVALFAVLLIVCCGLPFLLLSGISLAAFRSKWPLIAGAVASVSVVMFASYRRRGCAERSRRYEASASQRRRSETRLDTPFNRNSNLLLAESRGAFLKLRRIVCLTVYASNFEKPRRLRPHRETNPATDQVHPDNRSDSADQ